MTVAQNNAGDATGEVSNLRLYNVEFCDSLCASLGARREIQQCQLGAGC